MKQLEDKVAELEGMLKTDQPSNNVLSSSTSDSSSSQLALNGSDLPLSSGFDLPIDINMLDSLSGSNGNGQPGNSFPHFSGSIFDGTPPYPQSTAPAPVPPPEEAFDFSTLDPSFMNLVNSFQNTSTGIPDTTMNQTPGSGMAYNPFDNQPTGLTPFTNPNMAGPPSVPAQPNSGFSPGDMNASLFSSSADISQSNSRSPPGAVPYQAYVTDLEEPKPKIADTPSSGIGGADRLSRATIGVSGDYPGVNYSSQGGNPAEMRGGPSGSNSTWSASAHFGWKKDSDYEGVGMGLVGGWFDAADLPRVARDHLYVNIISIG